jgi:hypothetical protein
MPTAFWQRRQRPSWELTIPGPEARVTSWIHLPSSDRLPQGHRLLRFLRRRQGPWIYGVLA